MATQIIPFPQRGTNQLAATALPGPTTASKAASSFAKNLPEHYRGLHLVLSTAVAASSYTQYEAGREDTQHQAYRIVAQVEQEIASQANRQRELQFRGHATAPAYPVHPLPAVTQIDSIDTPARVARRLFHALLAFARPA